MSKKPEGIPEEVINAMCLTWRHDFGLNAPEPDSGGRMAWSDGAAMGMTQAQKDGLRMQMRQLYQHHVLPAIQAAVEAERDRVQKLLHNPAAVYVNWLRGDIAAESIIAEERERCAATAEVFRDPNPFPTITSAIAVAIRNRPLS